MKKIFLLFLCSIWSVFVLAQHELKQQYLIYLYDGSFLKGELVAEDEQSIQLKIITGETITLPLELVQKISSHNQKYSLLPKGITIQESGAYNIISGGLLLKRQVEFSDKDIPTGYSLSYINGHQFNRYVALGMGISFDTYGNHFIPVYIDFRGYLFHKKIDLYYSINAGYSLTFDQFKKDKDDSYYKGGAMINPGLGIRIAGKQNYSFIMGLGYRFQFAKREYTWSEFTDEIIYRRLSLSMGYIF